ncbi:TrbG/VirB9 family P-type conjugative transfer protein [Erythrobacter sp. T5W1-R]|uniref:TrbG/VirB9 family P-type conjugative transfer protein n=1 Tax=Erythrobacter sp. T5W1-R TaxID=3101752 RepID=UPI002AFF5651|nr:TrbG/VirB9 family P-type conjugative transfer protein [Erythrobacter sp. T5W1-R]MEA1617909.1 TrbG/VirB9 family P-type conjugative transfer protein [Erythrobacter sp. T5W1-R]
MIRRPIFAAPVIAVLLAVAPAQASDPRIQTRVFEEAQVVPIQGRVKVQTTIKFGPDEVIENVAIGDSAAWQVQPNRAQSILFVKPLEPAARTNLTVVTSRRTYLFDLIASPRNAPLYVLQFRYPDIERAEEEARLAAAAEAERAAADPVAAAAAADRFAVVDPAQLNFAWSGAGSPGLLPERTYDNGEAVFLVWPAGRAVPAILTLDDEGNEGPVNSIVRDDVIVIDGMPAQIILRFGDEVATLTNTSLLPPAKGKSKRAERAGKGA